MQKQKQAPIQILTRTMMKATMIRARTTDLCPTTLPLILLLLGGVGWPGNRSGSRRNHRNVNVLYGTKRRRNNTNHNRYHHSNKEQNTNPTTTTSCRITSNTQGTHPRWHSLWKTMKRRILLESATTVSLTTTTMTTASGRTGIDGTDGWNAGCS